VSNVNHATVEQNEFVINIPVKNHLSIVISVLFLSSVSKVLPSKSKGGNFVAETIAIL